MKKIFLLLLSAAAIPGFAQERISTYSDKKSANWTVRIYENDPLSVREYTLSNGLRVITSVNHNQPRISTMIAVKTGSKNDPATNTGLAHYLEHLLFKGTDKYGTRDWSKEKPLLDKIDLLYEKYNQTKDTAERKTIYRQIDSISQLAAEWAIANEYDKMCQAMGAQGTNAFTSNEQTVYINDIPANMFNKWIALETERFRHPVLRLFHTELEAVYEEKNISLDRDGSKIMETLYEKLFPNHNYGKQTTIGTVEHLKNPSLKAIREYYYKYYVPNNMAIILSGDLDPDSAVNEIYKSMGAWKPVAVEKINFEPEYPHASPQKYYVKGQDAESVTLGFRMPGAGSREIRTAKMIDLILNNASAGLIDLNLVKKQKVQTAGSTIDIMNDYSVFMLTGKPREGQTLDSVKNLLLEQVRLVQEGKFDDSLLQAILLNEDIQRIAGFKDNYARCSFLMESFINERGYQKNYNELWEMRKIRKIEIQELAREFLGNDHVQVYKLTGEDTGIVKIEKPVIHPVELNRDKQSEFFTQWLEIPSDSVVPVFANFETAIQKEKVKDICDIYYVKNTENRLFTLVYKYEYGRFHNKALPMALEYLKYLGTKKYSADEFSQKMYALGCNFQVRSGDRRSSITLSGPEENFDAALKLMEDILQNAIADEKAFASYIETVKKQRANNKLNNRSIERQLSQYTLYGQDNPGRWILKNEELDALKSSDLLQLAENLYKKPHHIEYYGMRSISGLMQSLEKLHRLPGSFENPETPHEFTPAENKENQVYFVNYTQVQAAIYWWNRSVIYQREMDPQTELFNQYFGGDMSSVVFQNIREAKALAYSTYAYYVTPDRAGKYNTSIAYIGCQADKFKDAFNAMKELMEDLQTDENVFALSTESLKNRIETERIDPESLISYYLSVKDRGYTYDPRQDTYKMLGTIGMKDIEKFHKEYISGKKHSIGILADSNKISVKDLEKYGKVQVLTLEDLFGY